MRDVTAQEMANTKPNYINAAFVIIASRRPPGAPYPPPTTAPKGGGPRRGTKGVAYSDNMQRHPIGSLKNWKPPNSSQ